MKKNLKYALIGALVVCAGCADDNEIDTVTNPVHEGDAIVFGARAGFETSSGTTRTVYTDEFSESGDSKYERVDWVANTDKVRIWCEQASNPYENARQFADYLVTAHENKGDQNDYATLTSTGDNGALQWGNVNTEHHFYAVYPSPLQFKDSDIVTVSIVNNIVKGIMPTNQKPLSFSKQKVTYSDDSYSEDVYVGKPNMNYAFLVAHTAVTPSTGDADAGLDLSFHSIATALELELKCPDGNKTISLMNVMLQAKDSDTPLCGQFEADLSTVTNDQPYPKMEMGNKSDSQNSINVSLMHDDGSGKQVPLKLASGEKVQLTLFMLPVEDLSGLQLVVTTTTGTSSTDLTELNGNEIVLKAHLKHLMKNVTLSSNADDHRWLKYVDNDVILSQLSIPGTTNSYSCELDDTYENNKKYRYQTKTVEEQWKMGVRCFELTVDRPKSTTSSLGDEKLLLDNQGKTATETLADAVDSINTKVKSDNTEFAMIIVKYQPSTIETNDNSFVKSFLTYFDKLGSDVKTAQYKPGITVGDVRGSIMFIVRAGSYGEPNRTLSEDVLADCKDKEFLLVNGWGSLQDNWAKRGYEIDDHTVSPYVNWGYVTDEIYPMEYYMLNASTSSETAPTFQTLPIKGTADYSYSSNVGENDVWAQDWMRVVSKDTQAYIEKSYTTWEKNQQNQTTYYWWANWKESYDEKLSDAKATFDKAIADSENSTKTYFNHLGGYFIDSSDINTLQPCLYNYSENEETYYSDWGETYGDIVTYSSKINSDFYNYILEKGDNVTGPMGVIIFNRAGVDEASTYLPAVIVNNNFKFMLKTSTSSSTSSKRR